MSTFNFGYTVSLEKIWENISPYIFTLVKDYPERNYQTDGSNPVPDEVKRLWEFLCDCLDDYTLAYRPSLSMPVLPPTIVWIPVT